MFTPNCRLSRRASSTTRTLPGRVSLTTLVAAMGFVVLAAAAAPAAGAGLDAEYEALRANGHGGCAAVQAMVAANPSAVYAISDVATRAGLPARESIECGANKYAELLSAGAIPPVTSGANGGAGTGGGVSTADAGNGETAPQSAVGQPLPADTGNTGIAREFQNLFDEGTFGCPAIELMVQNHPNAVDEIVDVATRAGMPEDDSVECAARQLAAIGTSAPSAGPIPGDPPGFTPDPPLGEPKIIRPPDPPVGPPNAASPS